MPQFCVPCSLPLADARPAAFIAHAWRSRPPGFWIRRKMGKKFRDAADAGLAHAPGSEEDPLVRSPGGMSADPERREAAANNVLERVHDLVALDPLLQREARAVGQCSCGRKYTCLCRQGPLGGPEPSQRERFNNLVSRRLLRLAERACVQGDRRKDYQRELLAIIQTMHDARLVSQAFSRVLESHCRRRMRAFQNDGSDWLSRAQKLSREESNSQGAFV